VTGKRVYLLATDTTNFASESHVSFSPHLLRPHDEILQWRLQPFRLQTSRACAQSPITLTQICRRWHEIAEATSILWSKLCICDAYTLGHAHLLERWLYRAQDQPLSLVVSNYSDLCLNSHMSPSVILDLLLDRLSRWWVIDLWLPMNWLQRLHHVFKETDMDTDSLLQLSSVTLANTSLNTPSDEDFYLEEIWKMLCTPRASHPSTKDCRSSLLSIHGIELPLDELLGVLAQCPVLEDVVVPVLSPQTSSGLSRRRTTLPRLRSASFIFNPYLPQIRVFAHLKLPKLTSLYVLSVYGNFSPSPEELRELLSESGCSLMELRMDCTGMPPLTLHGVLSPAFPLLGGLENLEITRRLPNSFFAKLILSFNPLMQVFEMFPRLHNISVLSDADFRN